MEDNTYTIDIAIQAALDEAKEKHEKGKLFKPHESDNFDSMDYSDGDPETLYTIAALYGQFVQGKRYDEAVEIIEAMLIQTYPEYE